MPFHIVESIGEYLIVETYHYGPHYFSKIYPLRFNNVDKAKAYAIMLAEDGVPVNSISSGNIVKGAADMGFTPLLLKRELKRRKKGENGGTVERCVKRL